MRLTFLSALALLFIALKLLGCIAWSWWWVLAPLWAIPAVVLGVLGFCVFGVGAAAVGVRAIDAHLERQRRRDKAAR